jgi:membrane associated rhomboid family serine protease
MAASFISPSTCSRCTCFGGPIEQVFGPRRYLIYYLVCVLSAPLSQLIVAAMMGGVYPTVGASGGVFGLLLAYAIYFPAQRVILLFPPIPMPARVFVFVYAVIELYLGVTGSQAGWPISRTSAA